MKTKLLFALMCGVLGAVGLVFVQLISFFCIYPCFLREADLILILSSCLFLLSVTNARPSAEVENVTGIMNGINSLERVGGNSYLYNTAGE